MVKKEVKHCPTCGQIMMLYRRNIRKNMLWMLRRLGFEFAGKYMKPVKMEERANIISDFTKLKYWGLIEEHRDNKNHYRITDLGAKFIRGMVSIPKYKWIYDGQVKSDPVDEVNPEIFCWEIAPQDMGKNIVLEDAKRYPYSPTTQQSFL